MGPQRAACVRPQIFYQLRRAEAPWTARPARAPWRQVRLAASLIQVRELLPVTWVDRARGFAGQDAAAASRSRRFMHAGLIWENGERGLRGRSRVVGPAPSLAPGAVGTGSPS